MRKISKLLVAVLAASSFTAFSTNVQAKTINHHYRVAKSNSFPKGKYTAGYITGNDGAKIYNKPNYTGYKFKLKENATKYMIDPVSKGFYKIKIHGKTGYVSHYLVSPFNTYKLYSGAYLSTLKPTDKRIVLEKGLPQSYKSFWQHKGGKNFDIWDFKHNVWTKEKN